MDGWEPVVYPYVTKYDPKRSQKLLERAARSASSRSETRKDNNDEKHVVSLKLKQGATDALFCCLASKMHVFVVWFFSKILCASGSGARCSCHWEREKKDR